jgi:16S rRNA (cytosine967-C5)-methyltransferase
VAINFSCNRNKLKKITFTQNIKTLSHHHSHITSAIKIIETAKVGEPLVHHLKKSFAANKKFGSKDRKSIASLCYNFYRIGNALKNKAIEERILAATFLCNNTNNDLLAALAPDFYAQIKLSIEKKCTLLNINTKHIFPFENELEEDIDKAAFAYSFLKQPLFFVRLRPNSMVELLEKLTEAEVAFEEINTSCIALSQGTKLEELFLLNKEVVVQDRNSQQVFNYLQKSEVFLSKDPVVWDCCAASGGKSILLYDILHGHVDLHVSDVRAHMLNNLRTRFKEAGIKNYHAFTVDLMSDAKINSEKKYDIIVCDAPCTGSGTWARTPEQLAFFEQKNIASFVQMQQKIAANAIKSLKKTGLFFYITCSVFKRENEDVVMYLKEKFHLQVLQMEYLKGYDLQADTMFVAVCAH